MKKTKKSSRRLQGRARKIVAAQYTTELPVAVTKVAVSAKAEVSQSIIKDVLGSFAEQTGANFG